MAAGVSGSTPRSALGIGFGVLALGLVPVWDRAFISSVDYYNHISRMVLLARLTRQETQSAYFAPAWSFLPVQAIDAVGYVLTPWVDAVWLGRIVLTLAFALLVSGTLTLHRCACGRWSVWPAVGGVLLLNRMVMAGVVNTLIGLGLALHGLALWYALRDRGAWVRCIAMLAMAWLICLSHLAAFGFFAIALSVMVVVRLVGTGAVAWRRVGAAGELAFVLLPPLVAAVLSTPKTAASFVVSWHTMASRIAAFLVPLTYAPGWEALGFALVFAAAGFCAWRGPVRLNPELAAAGGVLVLVQLAMPNYIATSGGADHRLPLGIWLLAIAAIDLPVGRALPRALLVGSMLLCGGIKAVVADRAWARDGLVYEEVLRVVGTLPEGARVAFAQPRYDTADGAASSAAGLVNWWVVPRGGFVQTEYALPSQAPMVFRPEWFTIAERMAMPSVWALLTKPEAAYNASDRLALQTLPRFDYVVAVCGEGCPVFRVAASLRPVRSAPHIAVFAVARQQ